MEPSQAELTWGLITVHLSKSWQEESDISWRTFSGVLHIHIFPLLMAESADLWASPIVGEGEQDEGEGGHMGLLALDCWARS
jgi:hypothetical protein